MNTLKLLPSDWQELWGGAPLVVRSAMKPETVKIVLPDGVAETLPVKLTPETKTLWRLGDPPIEDFLG